MLYVSAFIAGIVLELVAVIAALDPEGRAGNVVLGCGLGGIGLLMVAAGRLLYLAWDLWKDWEKR